MYSARPEPPLGSPQGTVGEAPVLSFLPPARRCTGFMRELSLLLPRAAGGGRLVCTRGSVRHRQGGAPVAVGGGYGVAGAPPLARPAARNRDIAWPDFIKRMPGSKHIQRGIPAFLAESIVVPVSRSER